MWRTANIDDPIPVGVKWCHDTFQLALRDLETRVKSNVPSLSNDVMKLAHCAWENFTTGWGTEPHHTGITLRDKNEPEFQDACVVMVNSVFGDPVWSDLDQILETYARSLPDREAAWLRLGNRIGKALDPLESQALTGLPAVVNQLSEMKEQPLLDGLDIRYAPWTFEGIAELHRELWARLTGSWLRLADPARAEVIPNPSTASAADSESATIEDRALLLLISDPTLSVTQIARRLSCQRTSLYRMSRFTKAIAILKSGKQRYRQGLKSHDRNRGNCAAELNEHDSFHSVDE